MKKYALLSLLVFASCSRAITPDMLSRVGDIKTSAKLGEESDEMLTSGVEETEEVSATEGGVEQSNTTEIDDRIKVWIDFANHAKRELIFLDTQGHIPSDKIPATPRRNDGFFVASWKAADGRNYKSLSDFEITEDTVIQAVWKKAQPITIELHLKGGVSYHKQCLLQTTKKNEIIVFSDEVLYFEIEYGKNFADYCSRDKYVWPVWPFSPWRTLDDNPAYGDLELKSYTVEFEGESFVVELYDDGREAEVDWEIPPREEGGEAVVYCNWG